AGEVQVLFGSVASTIAQIKAGRLRAIAVTGPKRSPLMPDLPTMEESGFPGFRVTAWDSVLAPGGTSQSIIDRLNREIVKVLSAPDVRAAIVNIGYDPTGTTPAELARIISTEAALWADVIKAANIRIDN
ncbi:MAG: tripartite tricarboxylate transporter substrate-binding protein, partial [Burkholderiales bacterium]